MRRRKKFVAPALLSLAFASLLWGWFAHPAPQQNEQIVTLLVFGMIAFGAKGMYSGSVQLLRICSIAPLILMAVLLSINLFGSYPFGFNPYPGMRYSIFLLMLVLAMAAGIARGSFGARWVAIAMCTAGVCSAAINLVGFYPQSSVLVWSLGLHLSGAALVLACLVAPPLRDAFYRDAPQLWTSKRPVLRIVRWTISANIVAIPLLLVFAWDQPLVESTARLAPILAAVSSVALVLTIRRKTVGAILLACCGICLLFLAVYTTWAAHTTGPSSARLSYYYLVFWLPAGLLSMICAASISRPALMLLRTRD